MDALEDRWALTKYGMTDEGQRLRNVRALHLEAHGLAQRYPGRAEPLIWEALIYIVEAEVHSSTASLGALRRARELLEQAGKIDGAALNGAVHANLGSLYYEVPGWPISFGSNAKAEAHLRQALAHDREGREANYFYGDFLLQRKRPKEALFYLEKALNVPIDPAHVRANKGRRKEVQAALDKARAALAR
jgi:tetratricopeptide (TPR) repeat protein